MYSLTANSLIHEHLCRAPGGLMYPKDGITVHVNGKPLIWARDTGNTIAMRLHNDTFVFKRNERVDVYVGRVNG